MCPVTGGVFRMYSLVCVVQRLAVWRILQPTTRYHDYWAPLPHFLWTHPHVQSTLSTHSCLTSKMLSSDFVWSSPRTQMSHVCGIQWKRLQPTGLHFLPPVRRCLLHHYRTEWVIAPMIAWLDLDCNIHTWGTESFGMSPSMSTQRVFLSSDCNPAFSLRVYECKQKTNHTHTHPRKERESTDLGKGQIRDNIRTANILYMTQKKCHGT